LTLGNDMTVMGTGAAIINALAGSNGITMGKLTMGANQELIGYKASGSPAVTNVVIFPTASIAGNVTFSPHSTSFGAASQFGTDFSLGAITESVGGSSLTKGGLGNVFLTGANTYSGNTIVTNGILFLKGGASIAASPNIVIGGGGVLDVTNLLSTFTLGAAQTLSNITSTAALSGNVDASLGTISLRYASGVPSFTVSNGALTVASSTPFKVNNTGAALVKGSYKLISAANGGSVAGTAPSSVTVGGNGVAGAGATTLQINGNELFLVTPNSAPTIAHIVTNSVTSGLTWKIAASALKTAAGWADVDNDTLTITAAGPTSNLGKSVTEDGNFVYYNAAVTGEDFFSYTISDGTATANGTIYLESSGPPPAPANVSLIIPGGDGVPTITFAGIPGRTNVVEASSNLVDWNSISTNVAGTNGLWQVIDGDATNFVNRYYRSYQVYP
jgi:autotransporter-associated beta strand protein